MQTFKGLVLFFFKCEGLGTGPCTNTEEIVVKIFNFIINLMTYSHLWFRNNGNDKDLSVNFQGMYLRAKHLTISQWVGFTHGFHLFFFKSSKISASNRNGGADLLFPLFQWDGIASC